MNTQEQITAAMTEASERIDERTEALDARHGTVAAGMTANAMITLDGTFDVIFTTMQLLPEDEAERGQIISSLFSVASETMAMIAINICTAAGLDKEKTKAISMDAMGLLAERKGLTKKVQEIIAAAK